MNRQKAGTKERFDFSQDAELFRRSLLRSLKSDGRRLSLDDAALIAAAGEQHVLPKDVKPDDPQDTTAQ